MRWYSVKHERALVQWMIPSSVWVLVLGILIKQLDKCSIYMLAPVHQHLSCLALRVCETPAGSMVPVFIVCTCVFITSASPREVIMAPARLPQTHQHSLSVPQTSTSPVDRQQLFLLLHEAQLAKPWQDQNTKTSLNGIQSTSPLTRRHHLRTRTKTPRKLPSWAASHAARMTTCRMTSSLVAS